MFAWVRHHLGVITLCFATWTAGVTIATYRERSALLPEIERAYLDGLRDAGGAVESCRDRPDLCSDTPPIARIQEDDPAWDCTTMGNRKCGDDSHPRIPDTTRRSASR